MLPKSEEGIEDQYELSELRSRGKPILPEDIHSDVIIEKEIKNSDTLHTISLRYGCPVAELKRVNNLIRDQDFFALKLIKLPVKRHGLILEILDQENQFNTSQNNSVFEVPVLSEEEFISDTDSLLPHSNSGVRTLSIRDTLADHNKEADNFLRRMDSDIKNIVTSTKNQLDSLEEVTNVLTCRRIFPMRQKKQQSWGADCGIRWWNIVLAVFLIGLVTPLLYFVYYEYVKPP